MFMHDLKPFDIFFLLTLSLKNIFYENQLFPYEPKIHAFIEAPLLQIVKKFSVIIKENYYSL